MVIVGAILGGHGARRASSASAQDSTEPSITMSVAPRWQTAKVGSWTPYEVTVANRGTTDVDGEILLVPQPEPVPVPGAKPVPVPGPNTAAVAAGRAVAPAGPPPDGYPVYTASFELAAGAEKAVPFLVVEPPFGYGAELRDRSGATLARVGPQASSPGGPGAILLTDVVETTAADAMLGSLFAMLDSLPTGLTARPVFTRVSARDFPSEVLSLSGLHTVIIGGFDTAKLSRPQLDALRDFVAFGGTLVVWAGARSGFQGLGALGEELTPLHPLATTTVSLAAVAGLAGVRNDVTGTVVTGELRHGRPLLDNGAGIPLVVESSYGAGPIVQLTYDPLAEGLLADPVLSAAGWGPVAAAVTHVPPAARSISNLTLQLRGAGLGLPTDSGWPRPLSMLLVVYVVGVGMVGSVLVRRRGVRMGFSVFLMAVVAGAAVMVAGGDLSARRASMVIEINIVAPSGAVVTESYSSLAVTPSPQPVGRVASTVLTPWFPVAPAGPEKDPISGGGGGTLVLRPTGNLQPTVQGASRLLSVQTLESGHRPLGLDANVVVNRDYRFGGIPRGVAGRITNRGAKTLRHVRVQAPNGTQAYLADELAPGQSVDVKADLGLWPSPASSNTGLLQAAAARALAHDGVLALVAEIQAPADPPRRALKVLVQTIQPRHDAPTAEGPTPATRMVSAVPVGRAEKPANRAGVSPDRWVRVYDLAMGSTTGSVSLVSLGSLGYLEPSVDSVGSFLKHERSAEAYDWTTGSWRRLARDEPLSPGELSGKAVRIRVDDPGDRADSPTFVQLPK